MDTNLYNIWKQTSSFKLSKHQFDSLQYFILSNSTLKFSGYMNQTQKNDFIKQLISFFEKHSPHQCAKNKAIHVAVDMVCFIFRNLLWFKAYETDYLFEITHKRALPLF